MDDAAKKQRGLVLVLRILGTGDLLAVLAVFLPLEWMSKVHSWLGMGALPEQPIINYLTRSASALYAVHGAMLLFVSTDVRRYAPLIKFLAVVALIHGVGLYLIDMSAGMPGFWVAVEGPTVAAAGTVVLMLQREERSY
ncbi:MAG TPA: hypothetical protein VMG10_26855 [Gemmataceae bacterium]|nr:hypothetical protein [Gemmataceae bacterium]